MTTLAWIGWPEWLLIGLVAVLLFGRRLPEVGKNLGRTLVEFKKGLRGAKDDLEETAGETKDAVSGSNRHDEDDK